MSFSPSQIDGDFQTYAEWWNDWFAPEEEEEEGEE